MLKIGIAGCGLQAATIASYLDAFGDEYEVVSVMDINENAARQRLAEKKVKLADSCQFFNDIDSFIKDTVLLDGIIIGTYCTYHTDIACKLEVLKVPIYMEKPVAVSLEQLKKLEETFKNSPVPVQVSLPMRLCPLTTRAKEIIDSGKLGKIYQVTGFEDTDSMVYFTTWFRDEAKTGGMFMQKAVHDIDYLIYLSGIEPDVICAMREKVWHIGDKDYELTCSECPDKYSCEFGPNYYFEKRGQYRSYKEAEKMLSGVYSPTGEFLRKRYCAISKDIQIEDVGECIIRGKNGVHLTHTQNFIASAVAGRRGARLVGNKGSLDIDFGCGKLIVYSSLNNDIENYQVSSGSFSHYGGDRELVKNFLHTMKTGERSVTDLITGAGLLSTLTCLCAKKSADSNEFVKVSL